MDFQNNPFGDHSMWYPTLANGEPNGGMFGVKMSSFARRDMEARGLTFDDQGRVVDATTVVPRG